MKLFKRMKYLDFWLPGDESIKTPKRIANKINDMYQYHFCNMNYRE